MHAKTNKLNFLLIMPRIVQSIGDGYIFPLGIPYISSSLKKADFNVTTLNLNHHEGDTSEIIQNIIKEKNIQVVATGGLSPHYHIVKSMIKLVKAVDSKIVIIMGGGIISTEPEVAMEALELVDFGVIGEGEITICELANAIESKGDFTKVDGIIFKQGSSYIKTNPRKEINDLDVLAWPDYEGFDVDKYLNTPGAGFAGLSQAGMISMQTSRSCFFRCTFCFHPDGTRYRMRSFDNFFKELDFLIQKYKITYLYLTDELFTPNFDRAKEFCSRIKKYNIHWSADFRINTVKPELLPILKDSGLDMMFFGIESADNRILKSMRKQITIQETEKILKMVYDSGIALYGNFIFGDIEETYETACNTLKWWREHSEYKIHLTLIKPFPGTYIYKYASQNGLIKDRVKYLKDGCPQINISKMSDNEFTDIIRQISEGQDLAKKVDFLELIGFDSKTGRETISGICANCRQKNIWKNIKLFSGDYIYCSHCGQKFDTPCPDQLRKNIDKNIAALLGKYKKVAVWGITLNIMDLFKSSEILCDQNIFPIEISENKRKMILNGKKVYAPNVLEEQDIPIVVNAVPSHGSQIVFQIKENHRKVKEIIDICWLVSSDSVVL